MIPEHTKGMIKKYVENGYHPGSFIYAVLTNNLKESFICADNLNTLYMKEIVSFIYNKLPYNCHGSIERVEHWMSCFDENGAMIREPKG